MSLNSTLYRFIILCTASVQIIDASENRAGEALFLSPLIKQGQIEQAQKLARVEGILPEHEVLSYSGFITVNEEYNTNLFFWFFPATNGNSKNAPVIFWSDGGPGVTMLNSLFNMHGPYKFTKGDKKFQIRNESSWNSEYNVIYLDNPAGVGFSFTENEAGYPDSGRATASDIYEFLIQFFKLFPELKDNEFYNGGASYGGTSATSIAHYIHTKKLENSSESKINLQGIIMDSPWIHSIDQIDYGRVLFNFGLISEKDKDSFDKKRDNILELLKEQKYEEAMNIWFTIIAMDISNKTGFNALHNMIEGDQKDSPLLYNFTDFVTQDSFRKSLHAGNRSFVIFSPKVQAKMNGKFMASVKPLLEELLDADYKVLVYSGNLDLITNHLGVEKVMEHLEWKGNTEFANNGKKIWMDDGNEGLVAGYIRGARNLKYALVRNAGHGCSLNQPERVFKLVESFIQEGFVDSIGDGILSATQTEEEISTTQGKVLHDKIS